MLTQSSEFQFILILVERQAEFKQQFHYKIKAMSV